MGSRIMRLVTHASPDVCERRAHTCNQYERHRGPLRDCQAPTKQYHSEYRRYGPEQAHQDAERSRRHLPQCQPVVGPLSWVWPPSVIRGLP